MLVLSQQDVKELLTMDELIAALEQAHLAHKQGRVDQPLRHQLQIGGRGILLVMPA